MARSRIPKPEPMQMAELEDHLFLLREQLHGLRRDRAHIKVIAAELRVLLCSSSGTEGLIWRLADLLGVPDTVELHTHGGVDLDHPLARGLRLLVAPMQRPGPSVEPKFARKFPAEFVGLRDVVKCDEAAYALGKRLTHEEIIRKVAEQIGSAHADPGVDPQLATLGELLIHGRAPYFPILALLAELALEVGERVLRHAVGAGRFRRRRHSRPFSIVAHIVLRERPLVRVPIVTMRSHIAALTVEAQVGPSELVFGLTRPGHDTIQLGSPLGSAWDQAQDAASCLGYDHQSKRLTVTGPNSAGDTIEECDLGYVDVRELEQPRSVEGHAQHLAIKAIHTHQRLFTPPELTQLLGTRPYK